jgi:RNA polymerase sigma factor (TIGR02999 family)
MVPVDAGVVHLAKRCSGSKPDTLLLHDDLQGARSSLRGLLIAEEPMVADADITDLLHRAQGGDAAAADALFAATYRALQRLARVRLRAGGRALLDTTSLVHESYLRLAAGRHVGIQDRVHFMRYAGRVMRSVIVDLVRRHVSSRRGGGAAHVPLTLRAPDGGATGARQILAVHEALDDMARLDPRMSQVVEMRYFGGLSEPEIAEVLDVTERTVRRDWQKARLWLAEALR